MRLGSSKRRASACMLSGKRMGNESVCVLAMSRLLFCQHLFHTVYEGPLFPRAQAVQSTGKGGKNGKQVLRYFFFWRLLFIGMQHRQRESIPGKQCLQVREARPSQAIGARDDDFCHLIVLHKRAQSLETFALVIVAI